MNQSYITPEDFVADESFIRFCFRENDEDVMFWENWIREHPEKKEIFRQAIHMAEILALKTTHSHKLKEWEKVRTHFNSPINPTVKTSRKKFLRWWPAAAVLLLLVVAGTIYQSLNNKKTEQIVFRTGTGENRQVILPDQTKVWLNADSRLIYQKNFEQSAQRVVTLKGEAFFEVHKDAGHPFFVHAGEMNIKVLGTTFNVRAYPHSATHSATLISGAIQVNLLQQPDTIFHLRPKQKFTVVHHQYVEVNYKKKKKQDIAENPPATAALKPVIRISEVEADPLLKNKAPLETAWMKGKLAFRNETFEALALQLTHKYGIQIHFNAELLKEYRFTGIFINESPEEVFRALQLASPSHPFTYRIEGKDVYIMK